MSSPRRAPPPWFLSLLAALATACGSNVVGPERVDSNHSWVELSPITLQPDGARTAAVTVTLRSAMDHPIADSVVRLTRLRGADLDLPALVTDSQGVAQGTLRATSAGLRLLQVEAQPSTGSSVVLSQRLLVNVEASPVPRPCAGPLGLIAPRNLGPAWSPTTVVAGDFNGDGAPDLVLHDGATSLRVQLNDGKGSFSEGASLPEEDGTPVGILAGDLNHDGKLDVVVLSNTRVRAYAGQGDGTFLPLGARELLAAPVTYALGDLDGDGRPDLAISELTGDIEALYNAGDGTFPTGQMIPLGANGVPKVAAMVDVDHDGQDELFVLIDGQPSLRVFHAQPDGTLSQTMTYGMELKPRMVAVGDFDANGAPDLVLADKFGNLMMLTNDGNGFFQATPIKSFVDDVSALAVTDLDGDGAQDLVTFSDNSFRLGVLRNLGHGDFASEMFRVLMGIRASGPQQVGLQVADVDGDGLPDALVESSNELFLMRNAGQGRFDEPIEGVPTVDQALQRSAVADMNGDGWPDVVSVGTWFDVEVLLNQAGTSLQRVVDYASPQFRPAAVSVGDLDGDGFPDVVLRDPDSTHVNVLFNRNFGTLEPPVPVAADSGDVPALLVDLNGDGRKDMVVANPARISVLLNLGHGQFGPPVGYTPQVSPLVIYDAAAGDLDGDGKPDVLAAARGNQGGTLLLALMNAGDGTLTWRPVVPVGPDTGPEGSAEGHLELSDLDGDGHLDVALRLGTTHDLAVLLGRGDGTFATGARYAMAGDRFDFGLGDLDGDGRADLVVSTGTALTYRRGLGDGTFGPASPGYAVSGAGDVLVTDFNADGRAEVILPRGDLFVLDPVCANP